MKASEALKELRAKGSVDEMLGMLMGEPLKRAIEALEREADAEEKAKPKVTLKKQREACRYAANTELVHNSDKPAIRAAADTLRRLDDEGGELLGWLLTYHGTNGPTTCGLKAVTLFRSLGVEPKS